MNNNNARSSSYYSEYPPSAPSYIPSSRYIPPSSSSTTITRHQQCGSPPPLASSPSYIPSSRYIPPRIIIAPKKTTPSSPKTAARQVLENAPSFLLEDVLLITAGENDAAAIVKKLEKRKRTISDEITKVQGAIMDLGRPPLASHKKKSSSSSIIAPKEPRQAGWPQGFPDDERISLTQKGWQCINGQLRAPPLVVKKREPLIIQTTQTLSFPDYKVGVLSDQEECDDGPKVYYGDDGVALGYSPTSPPWG